MRVSSRLSRGVQWSSVVMVGLELVMSSPSFAVEVVSDLVGTPSPIMAFMPHPASIRVTERLNTSFIACREPRPEICYETDAPVCAVSKTQAHLTYVNDCKACADPSVKGFILGPCS